MEETRGNELGSDLLSNSVLEKVGAYCHTLDLESFDALSEDVRKLFYIWAIYCNVNNVGTPRVYKKVLNDYKKLIMQLGVVGRKKLCAQAAINASQNIDAETKGKLKTIWISDILKEYNQHPSSVYFYDDSPQTILQTKQLGINSILVPYYGPKSCCLNNNDLLSLVRKKKFDNDSVTMVLLDFDKTIITSSFKAYWLNWNQDTVIRKFLGGQERLDNLLFLLKILEHMGVKIGVITMNSEDKVSDVLHRLNWY